MPEPRSMVMLNFLHPSMVSLIAPRLTHFTFNLGTTHMPEPLPRAWLYLVPYIPLALPWI